MNIEALYDQMERDAFHHNYHWVLGEQASSPKQEEYIPTPTSKATGYYHHGGIEVIDYIKAKLTPEQYKGYLLGNIYKYSGRCQFKGEYEKDVVKMAQYVNWLLKC